MPAPETAEQGGKAGWSRGLTCAILSLSVDSLWFWNVTLTVFQRSNGAFGSKRVLHAWAYNIIILEHIYDDSCMTGTPCSQPQGLPPDNCTKQHH